LASFGGGKPAMLHVLRLALTVNHAGVRLHHDVRGAPIDRVTEFVRHQAHIDHAATVVRADAGTTGNHFSLRGDRRARIVGIEESNRGSAGALVFKPPG
jgi:hypothetical protein